MRFVLVLFLCCSCHAGIKINGVDLSKKEGRTYYKGEYAHKQFPLDREQETYILFFLLLVFTVKVQFGTPTAP